MASNTQTIKFQAKGIAKLKKQYKDLERRTRKFEKSTRGGSGALGGMVAKLGLTTAALYGATKAISGIIKVGAGFEKTMSNVRAISGATGDEMKALEKNARALGATTVFTATQVGELQTEFAKLGFTSKEIRGVTKDTLALAAASGSDLATAAAIAGGTLKAFGMDVSKTSRVTDTMALSFSSSALDMDKFTNSMQYVGPIAKAAGIGVEGATAMLGTLANNMISGSMAGTSLRKILLEAGKEGSKLADRMGGPVKSMEDFQAGLKKLRKEGLDVMAEGTDLVGARAVTAFGILLDGVDATDKLTESLNNSAGAAQRMADIQLDNLAGKTTLLGSAMEGLGISLFDHLAPSLNSAVTGMTNLVNSMNDIMAIPTSEKLRAESTQLNTLADALKRNIDKEEVRKRLLEELNKNYPDFLKNINQEKLSIEEIETALIKTNKQYKEKIKIAVAEELIAKRLKESSSAFDEQTEAAIRAEDTLKTLSKVTGVAVDAGKSLDENLAMQAKKYNELSLAANRGRGSLDELNKVQDVTGTGYKELGGLVSIIKEKLQLAEGAVGDYKDAEVEGNKALIDHQRYVDQLNKILEQFGITQEEATESTDGATESTDSATESTTAYGLEIKRVISDIGDFAIAEVEASEIISQTQAERLEAQTMYYTDYYADEINLAKETSDGMMNLANQLYTYETTLIDNKMKKELASAQKSYEKAKENIIKKNTIAGELTKKGQEELRALEEGHQAGTGNIKEKYRQQEIEAQKKLKPMKYMQAISNTALGVSSALAMQPWTPANFFLAALVAAAGAVEIATINAQEFAKGGDFVTSGPQMIKVGDNPGGAERVQVTPLSSPNINGPQGGGGITLNIQGNMIGNEEFVRDVLVVELSKAQRMNLA